MKQLKETMEFASPVEIDETLVYKLRKGLNGRLIKTKLWVVGIIERSSGKFVLYTMKKRKKWLVLCLILKHVKLGTRIYSDCFSIYINNNTIPKQSYLDDLGYDHLSIDHSIGNFFIYNRY